MAKKDRDRLIRTFQKRTGPPRAHKNVRPKFIPVDQGYNPDKLVSTNPMREATDYTAAKNKRAGRVSTVFPREFMYTPRDAAKVPRGRKQATFSRLNAGVPGDFVPGIGQRDWQRSRPPKYGNPNIIPGYGQSARKRHAAGRRARKRPYQSPSAYGRGGPQWN